MKLRIAKLIQPLACLALVLHGQYAVSQRDIFDGLGTDTATIRESVERHTTRIETNAGAPQIPSSVSYRIFIQELLEDSDRDFALTTDNLRILEDLAITATQELATTHSLALTDLCTRLERSDGTAADVVELALLFDTSRAESERELDARFRESLSRLSPDAAAAVQAQWQDFSNRRTIVYSTFDLPAFAQEMPDAAYRILRTGCTRFHAVTGNR
jgi:hypothetical protein